MKKFMFTAIALVAFSGVSMAGTLEEKSTLEFLPKATCLEKAIAYTNILYPDQINMNIDEQVQMNNVFQAYLDGCNSGAPTVQG